MSAFLKPILRTLMIVVIAMFVLYPLPTCLVYSPEYVYRALTWGKAGVYDYQRLPGPHLQEEILFETAHAYQQTTDWHTREPDLQIQK